MCFNPNPPQSAIDRVISSYSPTIKALAYAREKATAPSDQRQKTLFIGMPKTPDERDLPFVRQTNYKRYFRRI